MSLKLLLSVCWLLGATVSTHAWWDGGHKAIALIAYERLTPEERAWVVKLLEAHPTRAELFDPAMKEELGEAPDERTRARWLFAQASIWCDLIRKRDGYPNAGEINAKYHHSNWHYTDIPVFPDEAARVILKEKDRMPPMDWQPGMSEPKPEGFNSMHTLSRVIDELKRPSPSAPEKAVSLCWLFHVLGDTHQPCHCAELFVPEKLPEGDRGANRVLILGIKRANLELQSDVLHSFWDCLWNTDDNRLVAVQSRVNELSADTKLWNKATEAASLVDPIEWLREGHALAVRDVYSPALLQRLANVQPMPSPGPGKPEDVLLVSMSADVMDDYIGDARKLARQQIAIAGVRLAAVLKGIFRASQPASR